MRQWLEQYKILMTLWDSEISRFYGRQNLYIGIQLAGFAGLLAGFDSIDQHPFLLRFAGLLLMAVGLVNALVASRGLTTQMLTIRVIREVEEQSEGLKILELTRKHARTPLMSNFVLSVALAWLLVCFWFVLLIYFEIALI